MWEDPPWNLPQPGVHIQIGPQLKIVQGCDLRIEVEVEDPNKIIHDATWSLDTVKF